MSRPATIAIDAMGGDHAPDEIVAGAVRAADELEVRVIVVGIRDVLAPLVPDDASGVEIVHAAEVIEMDDPATAVRAKKDSSIIRCAKLVKDGEADGFVSAGNTGATMAAALLRIGRIRGVARPAIGVPIPVPGHHPQILVDGGATVDCTPDWLHQFAVLGREYARVRLGLDEPTIGLLSNGEEAGKGDELRKQAFERLSSVPGFVGNVEGRDFMRPGVDVIVTDGFTGNVALKTIEGAIRGTAALLFAALDAPEIKEAAAEVMPHVLEAATQVDPDLVGGAVLLGVDGVCVVAHGSSSATAIVSSVARAVECVEQRVVERAKEAVRDAR
ncbi:MAG TPA: phosphate acyltransferase PlsX [Acidimicrobiia bacterium]|nr:phosphate acyltransferase PlsX [Acidimicrobiia bacterium]